MSVDLSTLRTVKPLTVDVLERMNTKALLKRLADLRSLHEDPEKSDWSKDELDAVRDAGLIAFKETSAWKQAFADTRSILAKREHVPRSGKEARRLAQQGKQVR